MVKRLSFLLRALPYLVLMGVLLFTLFMMGNSGGRGGLVDRHFLLLLFLNGAMLLILLMLIALRLIRLRRDLTKQKAGARLRARMVALFTALTLPPLLMIFGFSIQFLDKGIDQWFDVRVEQALDGALSLSQLYIDEHATQAIQETRNLSQALQNIDKLKLPRELVRLATQSQANELLVMDEQGRMLASSALDPVLVPGLLSDSALITFKQTGMYSEIEQDENGVLYLSILEPIRQFANSSYQEWVLQARYKIRQRFSDLALPIENRYQEYQNLLYLRDSLKWTFKLILGLVLVYSFFASLLAAFSSSKRLFGPLAKLAEATEKIASGDYQPIQSLSSRDEMAQLVQAFNSMTDKLETARIDNLKNQQKIETQNQDLNTILSSLDAIVALFSAGGSLIQSNSAFRQQFGHDNLEQVLDKLEIDKSRFNQQLSRDKHWECQIQMESQTFYQIRVRSRDQQTQAGLVWVMDDISSVVNVQRTAAWSEVAKRFAHEIKNPLTPIQLSSERLRHKFLAKMSPDDGKILDRATETIVNQVEALKNMVNDFTAYAQSPMLQRQEMDLIKLLKEVLDLYHQADEKLNLKLSLPEGGLPYEIDPGKWRQLFHNLIKNAQEASVGECSLSIQVERHPKDQHKQWRIRFQDSGTGFSESVLGKQFEPYATTKSKGTGLGLAIVRQIVEAHDGRIQAYNGKEGGACIDIYLPE